MSNTVSFRLSRETLAKLDAWPGKTRTEKFTSLVNSQDAVRAISVGTAAAVGREICPLLAAVSSLRVDFEYLRSSVEDCAIKAGMRRGGFSPWGEAAGKTGEGK